MKRSSIVVAALLMVSGIAHAEFRQRDPEMRPSRKAVTSVARAAIAKTDHTPVRNGPVLSVDNVLGKITTVYIAGLQRCYRKSLETTPNMAGKVTLVFTVDAQGNVLSDMNRTNPTFDKCLERIITSWRFPHVDEPAEATFKISLVLAR